MDEPESLARMILDLGLGELTPDEVKKKFAEIARRAHPDRGGDPQWFRSALAARDLLLDPGRRQKEKPPWDEPGAKQAPKWSDRFGRDRPPSDENPYRPPLPSGWRRSAKGNAWKKCQVCNEPVTVFRQKNRGRYNWVHHGEFGEAEWLTEAGAIDGFEESGYCE